MRIALFEPEIAGNVGAVMRLGACLGVGIDLIEPMGFTWDDRRVRRTAMDYIDHVDVQRFANWPEFFAVRGNARLCLLTTRASTNVYDHHFDADDILLFGKESAGVPDHVRAAAPVHLKLPIRPMVRSFNLATTAAIVAAEALRQTESLPR